MTRALLLDEHSDPTPQLVPLLQGEGFAPEICTEAQGLLARQAEAPGELLVLPFRSHADVLLLIQALRERGDVTPVLMLALDPMEDAPFDLMKAWGTDAHTHLCFWRDLVVHLRAIHKRLKLGRAHPMTVSGSLRLDLHRFKAFQGTRDLRLTPREFLLLSAFFRHPELTLTREDLLAAAWEQDGRPTLRTVDVHVARLRKKLGREGATALVTVGGEGYRWVLGVAQEGAGEVPQPVTRYLPGPEPAQGLSPKSSARPIGRSPEHPCLEWIDAHLRVDPPRCRKFITALMPLAERAGKWSDTAWFRLYDAWLAIDSDEAASALDPLAASLTMFEALGEDVGRIRALNAIGAAHHDLGNYSLAIQHFKKSFDLAQRDGHREFGGAAMINMATCLHVAGWNEEALPMAIQAHRAFPVKPYNHALQHHALGVIYRDLGQPREAEHELREAVGAAEGRRHEQLDSQRALAALLLGTGRIDEADRMIQEGLRDAEFYRERVIAARFRVLDSRLGLVRRDYGKVIPGLVKAIRLTRSLGARRAEAEATRTIFEAWQALGRPQHALEAHIRYHVLQDALSCKASKGLGGADLVNQGRALA